MAPIAFMADHMAPRGEYGDMIPALPARPGAGRGPSPLSRTEYENVNPSERVTVLLYDPSSVVTVTGPVSVGASDAVSITRGASPPAASGVATGTVVASGVGVGVAVAVTVPLSTVE